MIELCNLPAVSDKERAQGLDWRMSSLDEVTYLGWGSEPDEDNGQFRVLIGLKHSSTKFALFDTLDKAMAFYEAMKVLVLAGEGSIDVKAYE